MWGPTGWTMKISLISEKLDYCLQQSMSIYERKGWKIHFFRTSVWGMLIFSVSLYSKYSARYCVVFVNTLQKLTDWRKFFEIKKENRHGFQLCNKNLGIRDFHDMEIWQIWNVIFRNHYNLDFTGKCWLTFTRMCVHKYLIHTNTQRLEVDF